MKIRILPLFIVGLALSIVSCDKTDAPTPETEVSANIESTKTIERLALSKVTSGTSIQEGQTAHDLNTPLKTIKQFLAYIPPGYNSQPNKKWPLVLNLHGDSEKGNDVTKIFWTYFAWATQDKRRPYILITPQLLSGNSSWSAADLDKMIAGMVEKYRVDPNRIVITGYSLGGHGVWDLAEYNPGRYAGVVAIAGWGDTKNAYKLKNLPIWAHHGDKDQYVNYSNSVNMINAIKNSGGNSAKLTTYYGKDHFIHSTVYDSEEVINWILARRK